MQMVRVNSSAIVAVAYDEQTAVCVSNSSKEIVMIFAEYLRLCMLHSCVPTPRGLTTMSTSKTATNASRYLV